MSAPTPQTGRPLPSAVRAWMECLFREDFSCIRIYVEPRALLLGAQAFTLGEGIYFAPGQYQPYTLYGQRLIAHELTHVLQQRAGLVQNPFGAGIAVVDDPALEAEACHMETMVGHGPGSLQNLAPGPSWSGAARERDAFAPAKTRPRVLQARWEHDKNNKTRGTWIPGSGDGPGGVYQHVGGDLFRRVNPSTTSLDDALYIWDPKKDSLSSVRMTKRLTKRLKEKCFEQGIDFDPADVPVPDSSNLTLYGLQFNPKAWIEYDTKDQVVKYRTLNGTPISLSWSNGFDPQKKKKIPALKYNSAVFHPLTLSRTGLEPTNRQLYYLPPEDCKDAFKQTKNASASTTGIKAGESKQIADLITHENIQLWKPIRVRGKSQKAVMNNKSAADEAAALGMPTPKGEWHWCHLIAHSMGTLGNPQVPRNLVAGTKGCNGTMAHLETAIKELIKDRECELRVTVTAQLIQPTHVAKLITYKVENSKLDASATFYFYPLEPNLSAIQHQDYYLAVLMDKLFPTSTLLSTPQRDSFVRNTVKNKHFFTPLRAKKKENPRPSIGSTDLETLFEQSSSLQPSSPEEQTVALSLEDGTMVAGTIEKHMGGARYLIKISDSTYVLAVKGEDGDFSVFTG